MSVDARANPFRLGFLTAVEVPEQGCVGGLLVANRQGRPLEFQCTVPVRANRTQEILYGPTLGPFLLGELIGRTLVDKASVKPQLILTDRPEILELRAHVTVPVAVLVGEEEADAPGGPRLGRQRLRFHEDFPGDREILQKDGQQVPRDADMREPFDRVREALLEATRGGGGK